MTDNDKMREEFEKWYMRIHPHVNYMQRTQTDEYVSRHIKELWVIWKAAKSVPVVERPDCGTCENRGRVNGLSQETYCDSCVWQGHSFRVNHYAPQPKKEGE